MFFQPFGKLTLMCRSFRPLARLVLALVFTALFVAAMSVVSRPRADTLIPPTPEEAEEIKRWIPIQCCWSNNCCFKIRASDVTPLSRDEYRINATGQPIKRSGWSRDGQTWRCTCDLQNDGTWRAHIGAHTRCLFPAPAGY